MEPASFNAFRVSAVKIVDEQERIYFHTNHYHIIVTIVVKVAINHDVIPTNVQHLHPIFCRSTSKQSVTVRVPSQSLAWNNKL